MATNSWYLLGKLVGEKGSLSDEDIRSAQEGNVPVKKEPSEQENLMAIGQALQGGPGAKPGMIDPTHVQRLGAIAKKPPPEPPPEVAAALGMAGGGAGAPPTPEATQQGILRGTR